MHSPEATIAAPATPPGEGALAVLRVSGSRAREFLMALAAAASPALELRPRQLHHLHLAGPSGEILDEVLAAWMPGPRSYTGEDLVEISTHGSPAIVAAILGELYRLGAEAAHPGEFTYRAFINGRLDLIQAESVAELVHGNSAAARDLALGHLSGNLSHRLDEMAGGLLRLLRDLEAGIDFVEEDIDFVSREALNGELETLRAQVSELLAGAGQGRLIREGVKVVLAGEPNVGKSSLFNCLLEHERAIVTALPGTTRDLLQESWVHRGLVFHLHDTAGLRETQSEVERLGVARTEAALSQALITLWVLDGSRPPTPAEMERMRGLETNSSLVLVNKSDLSEYDFESARAAMPTGLRALAVSALGQGRGIDPLREALFEIAAGAHSQERQSRNLAVNRRQEARLRALAAKLAPLDRERVATLEPELVAQHLRQALAELDELRGTQVGERVLAEIFANFCVGK